MRVGKLNQLSKRIVETKGQCFKAPSRRLKKTSGAFSGILSEDELFCFVHQRRHPWDRAGFLFGENLTMKKQRE
jgi:hypothetical protein